MKNRYAMMLDRTPWGRRKALVEHLTCPACQGHHVGPIDAMQPNGHRHRLAERNSQDEAGAIGAEVPTHECRDCGFQTVRPGTPPPSA